MTSGGPRVLVVDDEPRFRGQLCEILTDYEVAVLAQAGSAHEALTLAARLRPDVVLMDLRMPDLDGITATRLLLEALPSVQVIILSAYDDPALVAEARRVGAYTYLTKGCPASQIVDVIGQAAASVARPGRHTEPTATTPATPGHAGA